jgi:hypothetical protein
MVDLKEELKQLKLEALPGFGTGSLGSILSKPTRRDAPDNL